MRSVIDRFSRRDFSLAAAAAFATFAQPRPASAAGLSELAAEWEKLEGSLDGRLGVAVIDTATGERLARRGDERFPMCSTFKLLAAGALLACIDTGEEKLERRVRFAASDLVSYSPVTKRHAGGDGMTLAEICAAALTQSDNTAGNLILANIGGPAGVTAFARRIGDAVTRLDRTETALNKATPGDPRDTTTPLAMAGDLHALLLGKILSDTSRAQLDAWLGANQTGGAKLRAGLPADWRIGDKTGGGDHGTVNDIAIIRPPGRAPMIVCVYIAETKASFDACNAVIANVGRGLARALAG